MKFTLTLVSKKCKIPFRVSDPSKLYPTLKIKPFLSSVTLKHLEQQAVALPFAMFVVAVRGVGPYRKRW